MHHRRFEILREVHKVRGIQLELRASVLGLFWGGTGAMSEESIAEEKVKGGFDEFPCKPPVLYNPQQFYRGSHRSFVTF